MQNLIKWLMILPFAAMLISCANIGDGKVDTNAIIKAAEAAQAVAGTAGNGQVDVDTVEKVAEAIDAANQGALRNDEEIAPGE